MRASASSSTREGDDLAHDIELALEQGLIFEPAPLPDEHLSVVRLGRLYGIAEAGGIDGHIAPAQKNLSFVGNGLLDDGTHDLAAFLVARKEHGADAILTIVGQGETEAAGFSGQEFMRNLHEHAAAVAGLRVCAERRRVIEVQKDFEPFSMMSCDFTLSSFATKPTPQASFSNNEGS